MSKKLPNRFREPDLVGWADLSGLAFAFGIVLLIGVVSGVVWIAWNLIRPHVLP